MTAGRFIAVVGPSGVGKDSVMDALLAAHPDLVQARRVITRPPAPGSEDFDSVSLADFQTRAAAGAFVLHWGAHGLRYGIPAQVHGRVAAGQDVLANLSRGALVRADAAFDRLHVLHITARADVLARRLAARGRETAAEVAGRLARVAALHDGLTVTEIDNSGALAAAVAAASAALYPESV